MWDPSCCIDFSLGAKLISRSISQPLDYHWSIWTSVLPLQEAQLRRLVCLFLICLASHYSIWNSHWSQWTVELISWRGQFRADNGNMGWPSEKTKKLYWSTGIQLTELSHEMANYDLSLESFCSVIQNTRPAVPKGQLLLHKIMWKTGQRHGPPGETHLLL